MGNSSSIKGEDEFKKEMDKIFAKDLVEFHFVLHNDNLDDCYILIKCCNYENHINDLINCNMIKTVLPNYKSPIYLSIEEVNDFLYSMNFNNEIDYIFHFGDFVIVKEGAFSDLSGIINNVGDNTCKVIFKFHTNTVEREFKNENIEKVSTIFDIRKMLEENFYEC